MTGFERNADVVHMTTPAPLFAHVDGWQWRPDQIWYDNTDMFKTVSYYVQQMYATNAGTNVLSLTMQKQPVAGQPGQDGLFASSVYDSQTGEVIIKVVNTSDAPQPITLNLQGVNGATEAQTITLHSDNMDGENTLDRPDLIIPVSGSIAVTPGKKSSTLIDELGPKTFRIYKVKK